jgi:acyl phosphate:glycerol-3-phosphate acyltransferase
VVDWLTIEWFCSVFTLAYTLGSIPFGVLLARIAGLGDLRKIGSGNIGATNVLRTGRKGIAALTLLLDAGKGIAAVMLADYIYDDFSAAMAGFIAVLGHVFPVWLRFRGGKGVATALGVIIALNWVLGLIVCGIWLAAFFFLRMASLASLISIGYSGVVAHLLELDKASVVCLLLAVLVIYAHRGNIKRILEGTEHVFRKNEGT